MGIGLGRESPVKLSLSKDNYVALIERHGQWVRWRIANKCSCVNTATMQPDIHCKICSGRGITYTYQDSQIIFETVMDKNGKGILEVSERIQDDELIEVYDIKGNRFSNAEKLGKFVYLNADYTLVKGIYYNVIVKQTVEKTLDESVATKENLGFYSIPGLESSKPSVDGLYYNAEPDIVAIDKITDAAGIEYEAEEFRLNKFRIVPKTEIIKNDDGENEEVEIPITEPVTATGIRYVPPFVFALLNQNLSKADMQMMVDYQGEAVVTFPYELNVSNDDVLTVLAGSYTNKEVLPRTGYETDTLGVYFVYNIISCTGIKDGVTINYNEGIDFILVGTNKIKWLENAENSPDEGEAYSIMYRVYPTYKVVKEIPQLRTSENQRFPKKAVVKLVTSYSDKLGINRQEVGRKSISGNL